MDPDTQTSAVQVLRPGMVTAMQVAAEFAGTFMICFAVYAVSSWGRIPSGTTPLAAALTFALAFLAAGSIFGTVSGAHFNPAVTFAAMFTAQTGWIQGLLYIFGQLLGAVAAGAAVVAVLPFTKENDGKVWLAAAVNGFDKGSPSAQMLGQYHLSFGVALAIVAELIASLIVVGTAVTSLTEDGRSKEGHVLRSAAAYGVGVMITYPVTGAGLNPARSTGIALFARGKGLAVDPLSQLPIFWICPLMAGAVVGLIVILCHMIVDGARAKLDTAPESTIDVPEVLLGTEGRTHGDVERVTMTETVETSEGEPEFSGIKQSEPAAPDADKVAGSDDSAPRQESGDPDMLEPAAGDASEEQKHTQVSDHKPKAKTDADEDVKSD
ncbi:aquaporin [Bifidobacterium xylocopae]|uniref:Glycerol transporter n=1 Tax=Bifidobacterium xylocopae TaxID=2493119 RepID=A0A366KCI3_9BIFI|nr:aquaporin [Bifidobacterium xylocopae]RBP99279.1 glycerol transporter [Bifidobacterium xylocopae]